MTWAIVFFGFISLIILHELGHFVAAKAVGMRVEKFFLFFPPKVFSRKRGETEYGIGAIPLGGYVKITGMNPDEELPPEIAARGYYHQPVWKRIVVIGAGPAVNIVLAFLILFGLGFSAVAATDQIGAVETGYPAGHVVPHHGTVLQHGDRVVSVDGKRFANAAPDEKQFDIASQIGKHKCAGNLIAGCKAQTPVRFVIERDGRLVDLSLYPRYDAKRETMRVGFRYREDYYDRNVAGAAGFATHQIWWVTSQTVSKFAHIFQPQERKQLSGVVGVSDVAHQTIDTGWRNSLALLAIVSLSLGLINLFPFLPLDGGHIFWSLVEKVRGRPVSFQVMERAGAVGFVLVAMLFFIGLSNDIGRLGGGGFNVR